jgi:hypothetical protein
VQNIKNWPLVRISSVIASVGYKIIKPKTLVYNVLGYSKSDPAGIRTQDPYIKSVMLYQLSYGIRLRQGYGGRSPLEVLDFRQFWFRQGYVGRSPYVFLTINPTKNKN